MSTVLTGGSLQQQETKEAGHVGSNRSALTNSLVHLVHHLTSTHKYTSSPIWILGRCYSCGEELKKEGGNGKGNAKDEWIKEFEADFLSRLWFTYRKGFVRIGSSPYTSDAGWGCMLRSGQMILAQAFLCHFIGRDWRYSPGERSPAVYAQVLRWFLDYPSPACPFSIHNLLSAGRVYRKRVGEWYGPHEVCYMLRKCVERHGMASLRMEVAEDGAVYRERIRQLCELPSNGTWRSLVLLVPLRLGLDRLNPEYVPALLACLQLPQCLGIIGGKPRSSLYFVGHQDERLFYLDPHTVQPAVALKHDLRVDSSSFHCRLVASLPAGSIDPSLAIGFYCRDKEDFEAFWQAACRLAAGPCPLFSCGDNPPDYSALSLGEDRSSEGEDEAQEEGEDGEEAQAEEEAREERAKERPATGRRLPPSSSDLELAVLSRPSPTAAAAEQQRACSAPPLPPSGSGAAGRVRDNGRKSRPTKSSSKANESDDDFVLL